VLFLVNLSYLVVKKNSSEFIKTVTQKVK
jgi:hypothetical protein